MRNKTNTELKQTLGSTLNLQTPVFNKLCFEGSLVTSQELEVRSFYHLFSRKTKSSRCRYVVMTRSETKLSVAIPAPVSGQSAVNVATATSSVR